MSYRVAAAALALLCTTACETIEVFSFREDPNSGVVGKARTTLYVVDSSTDVSAMAGQIGGFDDLIETMRQCQAVSRPKATSAEGIVVALAGLIVQSAINAASEAIQERIEALKQASKKGYAGVYIMDDASELAGGTPDVVQKCLLLVRRIEEQGSNKSQAASAFLIGVVPRGKSARRDAAAVVFTPLYARINKAAAVTRAGQPVSAAIGLSVVAIVNGKSGPERREVSLGAFQLDGLDLDKTYRFLTPVKGRDGSQRLAPNHPGTGLMALPPVNAAALEFRVAVVETGSALPDFDKSKAEIQAVRDALGPAVKDAVVKAISE